MTDLKMDLDLWRVAAAAVPANAPAACSDVAQRLPRAGSAARASE